MFYVRNDDVQNGLGEAMPNIAVTYYVQPGLTPASVYSDSSGTPAANPQTTNGLGQTVAYLAPGLYTITYSGMAIQTLTYHDQLVSSSGAVATPVIPTPGPDGVTRIFTLPGTPSAPTDGQLFLSGSYIPYGKYTISGATITWVAPTPPQTGDSLVYFLS